MKKSKEEASSFNTALIVGRFQPFHNGHLFLINRAFDEADKVKIVIGSANKNDKENPFRAQERKEMITDALNEAKIKNYELFILDDIPEDGKWVKHVRDKVGEYDIVFAWENGLVAQLFDKEKDFVVVGDKYQNIDATDIRTMIAKDEDYAKLVPKSVAKYLEKIYAKQRLKKL